MILLKSRKKKWMMIFGDLTGKIISNKQYVSFLN